jgi:endonuclease YncB( thermonuclease family)
MDGDTIAVHIDGTSGERRVRFAAVQAMELSVYSSNHPSQRRGECHAVAATNRVEQLIKQSGGRVRLAAQHPSTDQLGRIIRSIAVRIGGSWRDLGEILMSEGQTLWMPSSRETAWNRLYNEAGQQAAQRRIGLWNPTYCGYGPYQGVPLRLWVSSDPLSSDVAHINGEFIKVQNMSSTSSINLSHWWLRDPDYRRYTLPSGTVLRPGQTLTLHGGHGRRKGNTFYWGLSSPPFQNPGTSAHLGDGAYLFDHQGDIRAYMLYPCLVACYSPDQGAVRVIAHPQRPEYGSFTNVSNHAVNLYGYGMWIKGSSYPFGPGSWLQPGQTMRVYIGGNPRNNSRFRRYWGVGHYMLPDSGGWLRLQTFNYITLGCDAWGRGRC